MILSIILWIFDIYFGSFRDTWFRDVSGIFPKEFRIHDSIPGICVSDIFIFGDQENIFSFHFLFLFPFSFLLFPSTKFSKISPSKISSPKYLLHLTTFHHLHLHLTPSHGKPLLAKENTSLSTLQLSPSLLFNCNSLYKIQILYIHFLFISIPFFHFSSPKAKP